MNTRLLKASCLAVIAGMSLSLPRSADAFWGHHRRATTAYAMPSVPVVASYAPVAVARPVVMAPVVSAPIVTGYAPAPVTTFYAPQATTTFYAPQATIAAPVVSAPVTTMFAPAGVVGTPIGGPVTTTMYAPNVAAPVTSYYAPSGVIVQRPIIWAP